MTSIFYHLKTAFMKYHIKTAFMKIDNAFIKKTGCKLTKDEVMAIALHHGIPDAVGDYEEGEFDANGDLKDRERTHSALESYNK